MLLSNLPLNLFQIVQTCLRRTQCAGNLSVIPGTQPDIPYMFQFNTLLTCELISNSDDIPFGEVLYAPLTVASRLLLKWKSTATYRTVSHILRFQLVGGKQNAREKPRNCQPTRAQPRISAEYAYHLVQLDDMIVLRIFHAAIHYFNDLAFFMIISFALLGLFIMHDADKPRERSNRVNIVLG